MSSELIGALFLLLLIVLMFARMWIGATMAVCGFIGYVIVGGLNGAFGIVATTPFNTIHDYTLTAVPLFVFMGSIVASTGMGEDLYYTAYKWVGQFRGGLAMATVAACALFAAICGISAAEVLTMGKVAYPEMKKYKYDDGLATSSIACAATLGILIPPSIAFILYGILTEQSVGLLFMAGIFPGILLAGLFMITIKLITTIRPETGPPGPKTSFMEKLVSLKRTWPTLALFLLVLGGIYMGIFTPTEAGAIGAFGAIIISLVNRQLTVKNLRSAVKDTTIVTAMIVILIIGAFVFNRFLAISKLPFIMAETIGGLGISRYLIFGVIIIMYIILGMFLDIFSAVVLTVPLIYPVIIELGFDPIWFGVQMVILMEMGLVTPPVGMDIFMLNSVTDVPLSTMFRGIVPFVVAMLVCVVILTIFPDIVLFIPSHM